jgi:hypothetical protein
MAAPVTKEASSEQRNATTAASSDGSAARSMGIGSCVNTTWVGPVPGPCSASVLADRPVRTTPGQTQLARMLRSANSTATARVNCRTPPLDAS